MQNVSQDYGGPITLAVFLLRLQPNTRVRFSNFLLGLASFNPIMTLDKRIKFQVVNPYHLWTRVTLIENILVKYTLNY